MLKRLEIRNFALIDSLSLTFGPGLNVITGETGAGKSILVGALGLALGAKVGSDMVRSGAQRAEVTAHFKLDENHPGLKRTENGGDGLLCICRTVSLKGRSSCSVNGHRATVSELRSLAEDLADVHSQRDQQSLLKKSRHLDFLDAFGGLEEKRARVRKAYHTVLKMEE